MTGCASLPAGSVPNPKDPFERFNRASFSFNDALDRALVKPVATAYDFVVPTVVQRGVTNFFANISDLPTALNALLQGKPVQAAQHVGRVAINTTIGIAGLFDVATRFGIERRREDFGQTLGVWGFGSGPYLVLPVLGPSNVRDSLGLLVDFETDPLLRISDKDWRAGLVVLRGVQVRASLLGASKALADSELDAYSFVRDAYFARRMNSVFDGRPPEVKDPVAPDPPSRPPPADIGPADSQ